MSKDTKEIQLSDEEYEAWEKMAKRHGLTVQEEFDCAILYFFYLKDRKLFDELKQKVKPHVLKVFEQKMKRN